MMSNIFWSSTFWDPTPSEKSINLFHQPARSYCPKLPWLFVLLSTLFSSHWSMGNFIWCSVSSFSSKLPDVCCLFLAWGEFPLSLSCQDCETIVALSFLLSYASWSWVSTFILTTQWMYIFRQCVSSFWIVCKVKYKSSNCGAERLPLMLATIFSRT